MSSVPLASSTTSRLVLRDGSTAGVRPATPADKEALRRFFDHLSPNARRLRFLGAAHASDELIERMCENSDPGRGLTLIVSRRRQDELQIVGVGSYFLTSGLSAEVAFAVDDEFHGKGIATALLERLVRAGSLQGFESFSASVLPENVEMLDVFRDSGFQLHSTSEAGCVEVYLALEPSEASIAAADKRDREATIASLKSILRPRSVAVIGVSRRPSNLGRRLFESLLASPFKGDVYGVNPAAIEVKQHRCYARTRDLPIGVDLAVIAVPREHVLATVDECAMIGVKGIVVISAGFAEADARGRELQTELVERVRSYGMRMVGPNCMGVINTDPEVGLNASFAEKLPPPGRIALASQSGGLGLAVLNLAATRHIGLSTFVSLGNKADISGNDLLQYAEQDPATSVILLYLESFGNPRRFGQLARRVARSKPIVVVKSGRTAAGLRAAASHTAGLAASELAVEGLFHQAGVIRAETIDEMFDIASCLDTQPLPRGPRVGILTNAGGPGILAADACTTAGLEVLPTAGGLTNPRDMIASADAETFKQNLVTMLTADDVDSVIVIYTTIDSSCTKDILDAISAGVSASRQRGAAGKPVLVCAMASDELTPLRAGPETLPIYEFPERAARALAKATTYATWRSKPAGGLISFPNVLVREARNLCREIAHQRGDTWLTADELHRLMQEADLRLAPGVLAHSADEAAALARVFGFPVVAKMMSSKALHKTELGGVKLHLGNEQAVRAAYEELVGRARSTIGGLDGVLIQPMLTGGVEILIGLSQDPMFGPLVAFGLGGVHVELFRDVAFRIAPLTDRDADEMIRSIRAFPLLEGYRGQPPVDLRAIRDVLLKLSYLGSQIPELVEIEFNPVIALAAGRGCQIVDVRARVAPPLARSW